MSKQLAAALLSLAGECSRAYAPTFHTAPRSLKIGFSRAPCKVASVYVLSATRRKASTQDNDEQMAESDPLVEVRDAGEGKGFGAFARVSIPAGVELGIYQGERLTYAQLEKRYPNLEPDYVLRLSSNPANSSDTSGNNEEVVYVDAIASRHWSRFLNHDQHPNVAYEFRVVDSTMLASGEQAVTSVADGSGSNTATIGSSSAGSTRMRSNECTDSSTTLEAVFRTIRAVEAGEELVFDYGVEYWDGRSSGEPAPSTDTRPYSSLGLLAARQDPSAAYLGTPVSAAAVDDVLRATRSGATISDQRAALGRALTYFGVDLAAIPVADISEGSAGDDAVALKIAFENASVGELAAAVRSTIASADAAAAADDNDGDDSHDPGEFPKEARELNEASDEDEEDDEDSFDWSAWEEEKRAIEKLYGSAADFE